MDQPLSFEEVRIISSLIEKELTTPEYYPLTLNSLKNACNQKSNRDPVTAFDETQIEITLAKLRDKSLASRVTGGDMRVPKYRQIFTEHMNFGPEETAVMAVLMLRGPQTPGEIKGRTGRMFAFDSLSQVDDVLQSLINREEPLVVKLPKQTGMKEARYAHLLSGAPVIEPVPETKSLTEENLERILNLEEELQNVKSELEGLKDQFEKFKEQFE